MNDAIDEMKKRYDSFAFNEILVYYSFWYISTSGIAQYFAYCRENGTSQEINNTKRLK